MAVQEFKERVVLRSQVVVDHMSLAKTKVLTICQSRDSGDYEVTSEESEEIERSYGSIMLERLTGSQDGRIDHVLQISLNGCKKPSPKVLEEELSASESDQETESETESKGDEDVKLAEPSKTAIYNKEGLLDKLADISWPKDVEWIHKLSLDIEQEEQVDVNDDLARELAFYTQALEGTRQAFVKFQTMGLPFLRPVDYYAEMVKTDSHMEKIKGKLLYEKKRIEEAEERRKARDNKKKAKEVQAIKQKERVKQKKDEIESVNKWRKQRQQSGFPSGEQWWHVLLTKVLQANPYILLIALQK